MQRALQGLEDEDAGLLCAISRPPWSTLPSTSEVDRVEGLAYLTCDGRMPPDVAKALADVAGDVDTPSSHRQRCR